MKKILKSIIAFFFGKKNDIETFEQYSYERMAPGTFYAVYIDSDFMAHKENLFQVSKTYPELKKSTLYNAFKGDEPRTYKKGNIKVVECQKF